MANEQWSMFAPDAIGCKRKTWCESRLVPRRGSSLLRRTYGQGTHILQRDIETIPQIKDVA